MYNIFISFLMLLFFISSHKVSSSVNVAAVVDNEMISSLDVENRVKIIKSSNKGISNDVEQDKKLYQEALEELIYEFLFNKEAKRLNITVSGSEVNNAIPNFSKLYRVGDSNLKQYMAENKLDYDSFIRRVRSKLIWDKIVSIKVIPYITVSEEEIENAEQQIRNTPNEFLHLQETLIYDPRQSISKQDFESIINFISKDLKDLVPVEALIEKYPKVSFSTHDMNVNSEALPDQINSLLEHAKAGDTIGPFQLGNKYLIIKFLDRVKILGKLSHKTLELRQVHIENNKNSDTTHYLDKIEELKSLKVDCNNLDDELQRLNLPNSIRLETKMSDLDPAIQILLKNADVGYLAHTAKKSADNSSLLRNADAGYLARTAKKDVDNFNIIMLCDIKNEADAADTSLIKRRLYQQKVGMQSKELMDSLYNSALIEKSVS